MLALLRHQPLRREDQARAFRAFLSAVGGEAVEIQVTDAGLAVGGQPISPAMPGATELAEHLRAHGIASLTLLAALTPALTLSVLRALATPAGHFATVEHLLADIEPEARQHVRIASAIAEGQQGGEGGDGEQDRVEGLVKEGFVAGADLMAVFNIGTETPDAAFKYHRPEERYSSSGEVDQLVARLEAEPEAEQHAALLDDVVAAVDADLRARNYDAVIRATARVARIEGSLPEGEARRAYQIALRRMLPWGAVEQVARRTVGAARQDAIEVLKRAGPEAPDILLQQLVESDSMEERRAYYGALRQLNTSSPLLGRLLAHEEWFVIRNVAELCGDLAAEDTIPQLARHVHHADERVRRAVAGALAKIGTSAAAEPLRQMLRDASPQVRLQAVQGLDGARSKGLAMSLALAVEDEANADVLREMLLALGRIGSPDAVQALARAAAPGRRLFNRRPLAVRLAAIEALRLAGTPGAATVLQGLVGDDDAEIRDASEQALAGMTARRPA
ncbi:MAG: HEAT repeat domain-containing protein [Limisphaerales bacterium]